MTGAWHRVRRRLPLGQRVEVDELLDGDGLSPREIEQNLADLARLNRLPGGIGASLGGVGRLVGTAREIKILDVGTGRGDVPLAFAERGWRSVGLDIHPDVLRIARRETSTEPLVEIVAGDARSLPFADDSFDVSHCSLFIHHLAPADVVRVLGELRRVARRGVVVNDLRRGLIPMMATGVSVAILGRSRVTWSDGLASARRAYSLAELDGLFATAGLAVTWRSSQWLPRVVSVATRGPRP